MRSRKKMLHHHQLRKNQISLKVVLINILSLSTFSFRSTHSDVASFVGASFVSTPGSRHHVHVKSPNKHNSDNVYKYVPQKKLNYFSSKNINRKPRFMVENDSSSSSKSNGINIDDDLDTKKNQEERKPSIVSQREPTANDLMKAMGTSPRRIFLSSLSSIAIALLGNLFGITSNLLTLFSEDTIQRTSLDIYYPRGNFKRYKSQNYQYTFVYPKEWVADTALELIKQQQYVKRLDYSMSSPKPSRQVIPDAAFGPPGILNSKGVSTSDTNVSIIASSTTPGFSLKSLGAPDEAAMKLLDSSIAPPGSGKIATLISAVEEVRNGVPLYQFEYRIEKGLERRVKLQSISVITERGGSLITLTVVAPVNNWMNDDYSKSLRRIATSFQLL